MTHPDTPRDTDPMTEPDTGVPAEHRRAGRPVTRRRRWIAGLSAATVALGLGIGTTAGGLTASNATTPTKSSTKSSTVSLIGASGKANCSRSCLTSMVHTLLRSMPAHDPYHLPLAATYRATENSGSAAVGMMDAWRTITKVSKPSLLALDPVQGTAYFALPVSEGSRTQQSVLWGWIRVANHKITDLDLNINRSRGDHGFSFSPSQMPTNYKKLTRLPATRVRASRATLIALGQSQWDNTVAFTPTVSKNCQFTEMGWKVVDPGADGTGSTAPLGCMWPSQRPTDAKAKIVVVDQVLGIVVTLGVTPGKAFAYPYYGHGGEMISAFIPDQMVDAQKAQTAWMTKHLASGSQPMVQPMESTGMTMRVDQYYNGALQADQIQVNITAAGAKSVWED